MSFACGRRLATSLLQAQGRGGAEWTTGGYDAQRTASVRTDPRISVQTMQKPGDFGPFKFLWKLKLEYDPKAATALTQPILLDRIIGFRGFKSIAFVGTQSETVHAIDIDFGTPLWKYHINYSASPPPMLNVTTECPGGLVAPLSRPTAIAPAAAGGGGLVAAVAVDDRAAASASRAKASVTLATAGQQRGGGAGGPGGTRWRRGAASRRGSGIGGGGRREHAGWTPAAARGAGGGGGGFGGGPFVPGNDAAYVVGSDGFLHALNVQNGVDLHAADVVRSGEHARRRTADRDRWATAGSVAYAATTHGCGSQPDGVWAMELGADSKKDVVAFQPKDAKIAGSGGVDARSRWHRLPHDHERFVADVESAHRARAEDAEAEGSGDCLQAQTSIHRRSCFAQKDKDIRRGDAVAASCTFSTARRSPAGRSRRPRSPAAEKLESGALASWEDAQNIRWIAVPSCTRHRDLQGRGRQRQAGAAARLDVTRHSHRRSRRS